MPDFNKDEYLKILADGLHKPKKKKFKRAKIITNGLNDIFASDLVDMSQFKDDNDGYKYLLNIIDVFSRYAWSVPLKNKSGDTVLNSFKKIVKDSGRKPNKLWVDQGKEYINTDFKKWLDKHDILLYHTYGEHKASIIERFNRTLKTNMWKDFTEKQNYRYIDDLPELLNSYNNSKHSSINMTPNKASNPKYENRLWNYQYKEYLKQGHESNKFKVGDWVRISRVKPIFEKGYTPNWSLEIFKIVKITFTNPPTYGLEDYNGELIKGSFYTEELQKTKLRDVFLINEIIKTKKDKKGKKLYYVSWLGYPNNDQFNSWVRDKDLYNLNE